MRVAVTGAAGRLGRAIIGALEESPISGLGGPVAWTRAEFDLDAPDGFAMLLERDRPEVVVHAAAWTDVDGCARDPELALARNGRATGTVAAACAGAGVDLVAVSTNEVFDGARTDGRPYAVTDQPNPINPYGESKLLGERLATEAFVRSRDAALAIVRTAWLFGPPGNDFPAKILAAADRARAAGEPLKVVGDERGSPSYARDVADAIVELLANDQPAGVLHIVNAGSASRADLAREIFRRAGLDVDIEEVPASTWPRASTPPRWGVLDPTPLPGGEPLRPWQQAVADYVPLLVRDRSAAPR